MTTPHNKTSLQASRGDTSKLVTSHWASNETRGVVGSRGEQTVQTATGALDPVALGPTSMHDHVLTQNGEVFRNRYLAAAPYASDDKWEKPLTIDGRADLNLSITSQKANLCLDNDKVAIAELLKFKEAGGTTLVEASGIGLRGDPSRLADISAAAGVNLILSTGHYTSDFCPEAHYAYTVEQLIDLMHRELSEGIGATGIRAGHIKCGVSNLNPFEVRQLIAAAQVSHRTGTAVTVHPGSGIGSDGRRIAQIMLDAGMDPAKLVLAHADAFLSEHDLRRLATDPSAWTIDLDYHRSLLKLGVVLAFDCFGHDWSIADLGFVVENDWQRLAGVTTLVAEGFSDQIVLGTDVFLPMLTQHGGGFGYRHLFAHVLPWLETIGVSAWDIEQMTVVNPRRLLTLAR